MKGLYFRAAIFRRLPELRSRFISLGVGPLDLTITLTPAVRPIATAPRPTGGYKVVTK